MWLEELAIDPWARGFSVGGWDAPQPMRAGLLGGRDRSRDGRVERGRAPEAGRYPVHRAGEELRCGRDLVREPLPGRPGRFAEPDLHPRLRRRLHHIPTRSARRPRTRSTSTGSPTRSRCEPTSSSTPRSSRSCGTRRAKLWEITAEQPDGTACWRANAVISAVGFLSRPNIPDLRGHRETSRGHGSTPRAGRPDLDLTGQAGRRDRHRLHRLPADPRGGQGGRARLRLPAHAELGVRGARLSRRRTRSRSTGSTATSRTSPNFARFQAALSEPAADHPQEPPGRPGLPRRARGQRRSTSRSGTCGSRSSSPSSATVPTCWRR